MEQMMSGTRQRQWQKHEAGSALYRSECRRYGLNRRDTQSCRYRDGCNHRAAIGLEDIGSHSRHIADVVANVVGNHAWVSRIILGNARFDFSNEIRRDIRALGIDTAAHTREECHHRSAHAEAVNMLYGLRGHRRRSSKRYLDQ